jgi:hypothetical protein
MRQMGDFLTFLLILVIELQIAHSFCLSRNAIASSILAKIPL